MMHCQIAVATASISLLDRACLGPKSWTSEERLFSITFQLKATGTRLTGPDDPPCQFINCLATIFNETVGAFRRLAWANNPFTVYVPADARQVLHWNEPRHDKLGQLWIDEASYEICSACVVERGLSDLEMNDIAALPRATIN